MDLFSFGLSIFMEESIFEFDSYFVIYCSFFIGNSSLILLLIGFYLRFIL